MVSLSEKQSFFGIPEKAIGAFEALHGLNITVHDIEGRVTAHINPDRFVHNRSHCCLRAKSLGASQKCLNFDVIRTRREIPFFPEGRLQRCHAGLVEFVWPGIDKGRLIWVLFAGQILAEDPDVPEEIHRDDQEPTRGILIEDLRADGPADIRPDRYPFILESLGQLSSRLILWRRNLLEGGLGSPAEITQKEKIFRFINLRFQEDIKLEELSEELGLSFHRTSHLVNELFGRSFPRLLNEFRLRYARHQLRISDKPILDILLECGYRDPSYFSWLFRKEYGMSPRQFRNEMFY